MSTTPKDPNARTSIYVLKDPRNDKIRYVGKTVSTLKVRLKQHLYAARNPKSLNHRINWINSLLESGAEPLIEEIDSCKWCESQSLETHYIKYYKELGYDLVNETDGGEGNAGLVYSEERLKSTKERIRKNLPEIYQCDLYGTIIKKWSNAPEAAEALGISSSGITRCLRGERNKYKNYIWKLVDPDYVPCKNRNTKVVKTKNGGNKHSPLAKVITLETRLQNESNKVYIFKDSSFSNDSFLAECVSLYDAGLWCIDNKYSTSKNPESAKSKISACCSTGVSYVGLFFTYNRPNFLGISEKPYLLELNVYDLNNNFICTGYGLSDLSEKLAINKVNIINYLKCITSYLLVGNVQHKISWRINEKYCRLVEQSTKVSVGKIEENPNNLRITSS